MAVHHSIYNKSFRDFLLSFIKSNPPVCDKNKFWFDEFDKHLQVTCGDGLVLRPILRTGEEVISSYADHEFSNPVAQFLSSRKTNKFWAVELSWPDIYCFSQTMSGLALVDAENKSADTPLVMLHLPGMWFGFDKVFYSAIAQKEDPPRPHFKTANNP